MIIENDMGQYKFSLFFHIDFPGQNKVMSLKTEIKAIAIARGYIAPGGYEIYCIPSFYDLTIDDQVITSLRLNVEMH